jgi:hypothetical protein
MDELGISQKDDEILCTKHLSACVAIGVGHKFDRITRIFKERRMAHILGGNLNVTRAVTEGLFNGLDRDAMFVVAFGWLYEMNTKQDKAFIDHICKYCTRNSVPFSLRKTQWVYTSYAGIDDQGALLGSIQLFPNGDISSLDGRGIDRERFYFEIGAEKLRRMFSEDF